MDKINIFYKGKVFDTIFAQTKNNKMPAKEFLNELNSSDQQRLRKVIEKLSDVGRCVNPQQFKKLKADLWEFKVFQARLICYFDRKRIILTNGFIKKSDKTNPSEIDRASRIKNEFTGGN